MSYGDLIHFNLDELLKIEVDGHHVRFFRRDATLLSEDTEAVATALQALRAAIDASANWVRTANSRTENQEWYVNLDHVPQVIAARFEGIDGVALTGAKPLQLGVSASNDTSKRIVAYIARRAVHTD